MWVLGGMSRGAEEMFSPFSVKFFSFSAHICKSLAVLFYYLAP